MAEAFTDLEGLRIAVDMEKRGEDFYRRAARVSKSPEMVALLNELAAGPPARRARPTTPRPAPI